MAMRLPYVPRSRAFVPGRWLRCAVALGILSRVGSLMYERIGNNAMEKGTAHVG